MQSLREHPDHFVRRHIGPGDADIQEMLRTVGADSLDDLISSTVPAAILSDQPLAIGGPRAEADVLAELRVMADKNRVARSYLGLGYHDTITPPVILRNLIENPGWYTQYTPYQAEISQGRLEMLLNFQTMVMDLTGMQIANASLLDEGTAAAEAMSMSHAAVEKQNKSETFFVAANCHPQTIAVVQTRAKAVGFEVIVGDPFAHDFAAVPVFGVLVQYPDTEGCIRDYRELCERAHAGHALVTVATDLLALTLLVPPGEFGADIAVGNSQRFGVPLGFGGPHAAFFATKETFKRMMPGRIIGVSKDGHGHRALRMALQTREQHIRREKATSNICTAQVLLANVAASYALYHGPEGLRQIAERVHQLTKMLADGLAALHCHIIHDRYFDTLKVRLPDGAKRDKLATECETRGVNLRQYADGDFGIALDETVEPADLGDLFAIFAAATGGISDTLSIDQLAENVDPILAAPFARQSEFLTHPVFHAYRSETDMMRYLHKLESRDLSLETSMIALGSCTMKLNAATEMMALSWPGFNRIHPFAPPTQTEGYAQLVGKLGVALMQITGFAGVSFMPNSGAQGEYAGLLVIRAYHESRGDGHRNVCLIPSSAHGTNPASAVMAGMKVVVVKCDDNGNIDVADLRAKADAHAANVSALMVTYPSTHGVFEEAIREICEIVHEVGGQVYMDGANMNAQVGVCRPADFGADVCHLNLHKTFCIPHGGGGPGVGPICVAKHLSPFLPTHPLVKTGGEQGIGPISAAPYGSPLILTISWAYIAMMGGEGLKRATQVAILNANYMAARVSRPFLTKTKKIATRDTAILFANARGRVAHEFILDLRPFEESAGVTAEDVAKRLMDYGFHAPTLSFPVAGTLMIEPTESESKAELDRFCDALLAIREEIRQIETGEADKGNNVLHNAPHPAHVATLDEWPYPYSRHKAVYPAAWTRDWKFWPAVSRVDNVYGDRNLICACPPIDSYATADATATDTSHA